MAAAGGAFNVLAIEEEQRANEAAARRDQAETEKAIREILDRERINERALERDKSAISGDLAVSAASRGVGSTTGSSLSAQAQLAEDVHTELMNMRRESEYRVSQLQTGISDINQQIEESRRVTKIRQVGALFGSAGQAYKAGAFDKNTSKTVDPFAGGKRA